MRGNFGIALSKVSEVHGQKMSLWQFTRLSHVKTIPATRVDQKAAAARSNNERMWVS